MDKDLIKFVNLRMDKDMLEKTDAEANFLGFNRTQYILLAIELFNQFDKEHFLPEVLLVSEDLNLSLADVIQGFVFGEVAKVRAEANVYDKSNRVQMAFTKFRDENGNYNVKRGLDLLTWLTDLETEKLEKHEEEYQKDLEAYRRLSTDRK